MRAVKLLAGLAIAVLVHLLGVRLIPSFALAVDVFLVVVALFALEGSSLAALFAGLLVGLLHDSLSGGSFGLFGFADTIVGYGTARLAQRLVIQRPTGVLALVSFAAVVQQAIVIGLAFLLLPDTELPASRLGGGAGRHLRPARDGGPHRNDSLAPHVRGPAARTHEPAPARLRGRVTCRWFASIGTI